MSPQCSRAGTSGDVARGEGAFLGDVERPSTSSERHGFPRTRTAFAASEPDAKLRRRTDDRAVSSRPRSRFSLGRAGGLRARRAVRRMSHHRASLRGAARAQARARGPIRDSLSGPRARVHRARHPCAAPRRLPHAGQAHGRTGRQPGPLREGGRARGGGHPRVPRARTWVLARIAALLRARIAAAESSTRGSRRRTTARARGLCARWTSGRSSCR